MDRKTLRAISAKIELAIKEANLETNYGVRVSVKGGSYSDKNATLRLEIADVGDDGTVMSREAQDFEAYASAYGLSPDDLGKKFSQLGNEYEIVGLKPRSKKYPILAKRVGTDRIFKFPSATVQMLLTGSPRTYRA